MLGDSPVARILVVTRTIGPVKSTDFATSMFRWAKTLAQIIDKEINNLSIFSSPFLGKRGKITADRRRIQATAEKQGDLKEIL